MNEEILPFTRNHQIKIIFRKLTERKIEIRNYLPSREIS